MKSLTCLALLALASFADAAPPFAWAVTDTDARARAALALAAKPACKDCPCGTPDCPCGCCGGKPCTCGAGPKALDPEYAEFLAWKKAARPKKSHAELLADGWTYGGDGYYYFYPPAPPPQYQPAYSPPVSAFAPQTQFAPRQSFGGFGGGMRSGGGRSGGC